MEVEATVEGIRRFTIHGQPYAIVYFSRDDDPEDIQQAQLSVDDLPDELRVGERIRVLYVASIVVAVTRSSVS